MRFLADMGISPRTVAFLRSGGHEVVHLAERGYERLPDPEVLELARKERRILLTHDLGFGDLIAANRSALPSVITFRLHNMHPDKVDDALHHALPHHAEVLERGAILSIAEGQVRVRLLPIEE